VSKFDEALLLEQFSPRYRYRVPKCDKSVGYFFSLMENMKEKLDVDEYSASQTTLEQIFNGFARMEEEVIRRKFTKENMGGGEFKKGSEFFTVSYNDDSSKKYAFLFSDYLSFETN
jgi:hypothetical protein